MFIITTLYININPRGSQALASLSISQVAHTYDSLE